MFEKNIKAAAAFHDGEGYSKSFYKGSIAAPKDMNALKATSAGINKDSGFSVKQLKEELLAHSFRVGHRKEQDHFESANKKLYRNHKPRDVGSQKHMQDLEAAQNHARDWTYNWGLKQNSNLAQQMTPVVD